MSKGGGGKWFDKGVMIEEEGKKEGRNERKQERSKRSEVKLTEDGGSGRKRSAQRDTAGPARRGETGRDRHRQTVAPREQGPHRCDARVHSTRSCPVCCQPARLRIEARTQPLNHAVHAATSSIVTRSYCYSCMQCKQDHHEH